MGSSSSSSSWQVKVFWTVVVPAVVAFVYLAIYTHMRQADATESALRRAAPKGKSSLTIVPKFAADASAYAALFDQGNPELARRSLIWGSYRPNLYTGFSALPLGSEALDKNLSEIEVAPAPIVSGLLYLTATKDGINIGNVRYDCGQDESVKYGWKRHDGRTFGVHEILERNINLNVTSSFVKVPTESTLDTVYEKGGHWAQLIRSQYIDKTLVSTLESLPYIKKYVEPYIPTLTQDANAKVVGMYYMFYINDGFVETISRSDGGILTAQGYSDQLGAFEIRVVVNEIWKLGKLTAKANFGAYKITAPIVQHYKEFIIDKLQKTGLLFDNSIAGPSNFLVFQSLTGPEAEFYISFVSEEACQKSPEHLKRDINLPEGTHVTCNGVGSIADMNHIRGELETRFQERFSRTFPDIDGKMTKNVAVPVLSDLMGAVGYFYGNQLIKAKNVHEPPRESGPHSLLASVPSRTFFPRGFLWDEGFHNMLIQQWDLQLSFEIVKSWFSQLDSNGWVGREQILGEEARAKVPVEFQAQDESIANPPVLHSTSYSLAEILLNGGTETEFSKRVIESKDLVKEHLASILPSLLKQYEWYVESQGSSKLNQVYVDAAKKSKSKIDTSKIRVFHWNGQTSTHCLASGLDDFPRNPSPTEDDAHLDLLSWIRYMADGLQKVCKSLEGSDGLAKNICTKELYSKLKKDFDNYTYTLINLHLDDETGLFYDIHVEDDGEIVFDKHRGYIQLLPFIHGIFEPLMKGSITEPALKTKVEKAYDAMISLINELNMGYGLMSLSHRDPLYNTEENYWRGPIWMNFNILTLQELGRERGNLYLGEGTGSNYNRKTSLERRAKIVHEDLYRQISDTVTNQFVESGFLFEQYNERTGRGQRTRPFNGWTSLITLLLANEI